jgi:NAD(P)-dependent dehydrogenase (short-subunit alcohol dehydrogenase family)
MDTIDFSGRVAVVTGAGGGLGREYCRALAARGAAIVVNDLGGATTGEGSSADYADRVVEEIRTAGGRAVANYDSVATPAGGEAIIRAATEHFGRVDIVINNAGNQRNVRFGELTEQDIEAVYAVHVKGTFFVTQPAYRLMVRQGYGRIVLVSSQSGIFGNPIRSNYGSAKTAMIGLMNVVAQEAPKGIAINCVFPNALGGRLGGKPGDVRPDAEFLAAAALKVPHYVSGMQPSSLRWSRISRVIDARPRKTCIRSLAGNTRGYSLGSRKGGIRPARRRLAPKRSPHICRKLMICADSTCPSAVCRRWIR